MNLRKLLSNFSAAVTAQGLAMLVSLIVTLSLPKMLSVSGFSYWQLFIFYTTYVGFFHLGLNDGVYLINGGRSRQAIDKSSVLSQFFVAAVAQSMCAVLIVAAALFCNLPGERSFVIAITAIFMPIYNLTLYIGFVFQAMNETKLFSYSAILDRFVFFILIASMLIMRVNSFEPYVAAHCLGAVCRLLFCLYFFRDFLSSRPERVREALKESAHSIRVGIKLMVATVASMLILGVGRAVIDVRWGIETFGKFSLALSVVTLFLSLISQASMVLFPALRQTDGQYVAKFYKSVQNALGLLFPAVYLLYFPMVWLLGLWLPQYKESLGVLAYLLPICVFDSKMNIGCTTLMKVRREESQLLIINVVSVAASAVIAVCGAYVIGSMYMVIGSMVVAIIGRSMYSEWYMARQLGVKQSALSFAEVALSLIFVALAVTQPAPLACAGYAVCYALFLILFRGSLRGLIAQARHLLASLHD